MKWKKFTLTTTTEAVDLVSSMFDDIGIEGIEIEDNIPLTEKETKGMFIDILPELPPDEGIAKVSFYLDDDADVAEMLKKTSRRVQYIIANEAGASVYSASKLGAEEFPDYDVSLRSAVSIGRRIQDTLAELVKIDPKSIGVGQYQHDMNQKRLGEALGGVVEDCVNSVGVDLNTASPALLSYVAGIHATVAKNIL